MVDLDGASSKVKAVLIKAGRSNADINLDAIKAASLLAIRASDKPSALKIKVNVLVDLLAPTHFPRIMLSTGGITKAALAHARAIDIDLLGRAIGLVEAELVADEVQISIVI